MRWHVELLAWVKKMIDTICFRIDLCPGQEEVITKKLTVLSKVDGSTGEEMSRFCVGSLAGSWDSRIACSIQDREWKWVDIDDHPKGGRTIQVICDKWLKVEFSVQKWLFGMNCFTYLSSTAIEACYHFALWLNESLGVRLPDLSTWGILRVDMGHVVKFPDNATMLQYLECMKHVEYPRRKLRAITYQTTVMWVGGASVLKLYGKESEFKAHDKRRISGYFKDSDVGNYVSDRLDGVLRVELGLRKSLLQSRGISRFFDLENFDLTDLWEKNMAKIGLGNTTLRIWTASDARVMLKMHCVKGSHISADAAFAIWTDIVTSGRKFARSQVADKQFYRACKIFRDIGLSTVSNLNQEEILPMPADLTPYVDHDLLGFLATHSADLNYDYLCAVA